LASISHHRVNPALEAIRVKRAPAVVTIDDWDLYSRYEGLILCIFSFRVLVQVNPTDLAFLSVDF
jgi:hypothetical protein